MKKKKEVTPPPTKITKKTMPTTAKGCRRRRRHTQSNNNKSLVKTISLLFTICGAASLIALQYNPTAKTQLITKIQNIELKHTISNISSALQDIPKKRRLGGNGSGGIIKLTESSKLFDFDEEMDKSENAFLSVSLPEEKVQDKNPLERVLEGLEDLFNGLEDMFNNSKNNLRNKHRNMKASAVGGGGDAAEVGGETQRNWIPSIITNFYSPLAAPLIAFIGIIIFAIASFASRLIVSSPTSNSHRQVDENEAEIIQFYEKEMECGTLMHASGMPLFSQDVKLPSHPLIRQGSGCNSGSFNMNTTATLRRSVSDPEKTYRGSQGDLYYSRVLETLHLDDADDEGEGKVDSSPIEEDEVYQVQEPQEDTADDLQDCQITLLENISSLTEDDGIEEPERVEREEPNKIESPSQAAPCSPRPQEAVVDDEDTCFESAVSQIIPEQDGHQEESQSCPSSPESTSSTISSLTVEDYDIETGSFNIPQVPLPTSPPLDHEATPQRGNLSQNRKLSKRVSFSPDIKIREIPRGRRQVYELSSEMYLYIMLFTLAIVIAVFSFMPPPHPKLSPVSCGEMFLRAEKMLSSQWDEEL